MVRQQQQKQKQNNTKKAHKIKSKVGISDIMYVSCRLKINDKS